MCCLGVTSLMCKCILHKIHASKDYVLLYENMVGSTNFFIPNKTKHTSKVKHTHLTVNNDFIS